MSTYCKNCGHKIDEGKKFCKNCGTKVAQPSVSAHTVDVVRNHKKGIRINKWWIVAAVGVTALIASGFFLMYSGADNQNNQQSVVDILCDNGKGGSGTIFSADGTILTNNHVIAGSTSCKVTIPDSSTGGIYEIYEAAPVIVPNLSEKYDIATLRIDASYTDSNGKTWGAYPRAFPSFILPSTCDPKIASKLGDSVRIYGYPVTSGGYNLTLTDGVISSFADDGNILTSAQIDSGNSGGLATDQDGCWLGIPSAVVSGNYQNLGVIIPGNIVETYFLNSVPAKLDPATTKSAARVSAESAVTPVETNDQQCQDIYGSNSRWAGQMDSNNSPQCACKIGYTWDASGNACATQESLQQECQTRFGAGGYSSTRGGKAVCGCTTGYVWNSDQTACIVPVATKSGYQICSSSYPNSTWDGTYGSSGNYNCTCPTGYAWNTARTACVLPAVRDSSADNNQCHVYYGMGSYATGQTGTNGGAVCACMQGNGWNSNRSACVDSSQFNQVCYQQYGYTAEATGKVNANGDVMCQCVTGYSVSGGQCVKN